MSKKLLREKKYNLGIVESYKKAEDKDSAIIGSFNVKGMTVENMVSQNKTQYSKDVWAQPTAFGKGGKFLDDNGKLKPSTLFGSVDHPIDNRAELLLQEAAIAWYDVNRNEDGSWDGAAHILNNPQGRIVKTFLDYAKEVGGSNLLGVSSRALGESRLAETNGEQIEAIVPESFELMSFDFVYNPSFQTAVARVNESTGAKRPVLAESVRKLASEDNLNADIYTNFANKIEKIDKEIKETDLAKKITVEKNSFALSTAKQNYLRELRQQEKKLHDALHDLKMMTDEEFNQKASGDRGKLMKILKKEHEEITAEIDALESALETRVENADAPEATPETATDEEVTEVETEVETEVATEEAAQEETAGAEEAVEAPVQESVDPEDTPEDTPEEDTEEDTEDTPEEDTEEVLTEATEDDAEETEEEMEELVELEMDEEVEEEAAPEMDIASLAQEVMALKDMLQELRDFLMPVEPAELEVEEDAPEEEMSEDDAEEDADEMADELGMLDEEDLETLSDEELEYLANLEL